jgi:DNA-binding NarL/FixJ family response regulator
LTPSEADVANFLVKGLGIAEIAQMRGSAEGTIKSHLNSIYRKSGTHNRGEVLSLIIDSLMDRPESRPW